MTVTFQPIQRHPRADLPSQSGGHQMAAGWVLGAATTAMGLIAGLLYSFGSAVMPGLARTDDRTLIEVMREINVAIVNPAFVLSFFGALGLTATAAVLQRNRPSRRWILAALALYVIALAVTVGANIPLNDQLAKVDLTKIADLASVRRRYEGPWVAWNTARAIASTTALACLSRALVLHGRADPTS